jgi:hypothetical protein
MSELRCPVCQSDKVIRNCRSFVGRTSGHSINLEVGKELPGPPEAWWDTKMEHALVKQCHVCCGCGYVMFVIEEPEQFWAACDAGAGRRG